MDSRAFRIQIAEDNDTLFRQGFYAAHGRRWTFLSAAQAACLFRERDLPRLTEECAPLLSSRQAEMSVVSGDTLEHAGEAVLNFADAYVPGGLYLQGSAAQEECLCRASTLYLSLTSSQARPMYAENEARRLPLYSDTFLISPHVEIFRSSPDGDYDLLPRPRVTAVITAAAPNLQGAAAGVPLTEVRAAMRRRMRGFLAAAFRMGYRTLTLGAWGCGAFGHDAQHVAEDFRTVLVGERWQSLFDSITFAVFARDETGYYNLKAFRQVFSDS